TRSAGATAPATSDDTSAPRPAAAPEYWTSERPRDARHTTGAESAQCGQQTQGKIGSQSRLGLIRTGGLHTRAVVRASLATIMNVSVLAVQLACTCAGRWVGEVHGECGIATSADALRCRHRNLA